MLYHQKPKDYITEVEVAGCIIEVNGEILLMKRSENSSCPWVWQQPWWKVDSWENTQQAMIRETYEESGISIKSWQAKKLFKKYFHFVDLNIAITFYKVSLQHKPEIILSPDEHNAYVWVTPKDALKMNLIEDFDEILKEVYWL